MREGILRGVLYLIVFANLALMTLSLVCYGVSIDYFLSILIIPILFNALILCYMEKKCHHIVIKTLQLSYRDSFMFLLFISSLMFFGSFPIIIH